MDYSRFVIFNRAVCVWDMNMRQLNTDYIKSIDFEYFRFIAEQNLQLINNPESDKKEKLYASINLRNSYSMGLETMFALIGALLQAPDCVVGWMMKYKISELHSLVKTIHSYLPIKTKFSKVKLQGWESIMRIIFGYFPKNVEQNIDEIISNYAQTIASFASEYSSQKFNNEYNSIKHGFRIRAGGFKLALKLASKDGKEIENSKWISLLDSEFGTSFYFEEKLKDSSNNIRIKNLSINWQPENFYNALYLISYIIENIKTFLCLVHKIDGVSKQYRYIDNEHYSSAWQNMQGTGDGSLDLGFDYNAVKILSAEEIKSVYRN